MGDAMYTIEAMKMPLHYIASIEFSADKTKIKSYCFVSSLKLCLKWKQKKTAKKYLALLENDDVLNSFKIVKI